MTAPNLVFARRPLESLRLRFPLPTAPPGGLATSPQDQAWREALGSNSVLWYVRRQNVSGMAVASPADEPIAQNDGQAEATLAAGPQFTALGGPARYAALKARATPAASVRILKSLAAVVAMEASSPLGGHLLLMGLLQELDDAKPLDEPTALQIVGKYSDPDLLAGLQRLDPTGAILNNDAQIGPVTKAHVLTEMADVGSMLPQNDLAGFLQGLTPLVAAAVAAPADATKLTALGDFIRSKLTALRQGQ